MSNKELDRSGDDIGVQYLIICNGISQVLNEAIQDVCMVSVLEKLQNPVLFGQRFEFCRDPSQLPVEKKKSGLKVCDPPLKWGSTNLLRAFIRAFSSLSRSPSGMRVPHSATLPFSRCLRFGLHWWWFTARNSKWRVGGGVRPLGSAHVVVLDENRKGDHDGFERWEQVGRILCNVNSHPYSSVRSPPT